MEMVTHVSHEDPTSPCPAPPLPALPHPALRYFLSMGSRQVGSVPGRTLVGSHTSISVPSSLPSHSFSIFSPLSLCFEYNFPQNS